MSDKSPLDAALNRYCETLTVLDKAAGTLTSKTIISVLIARDAVQQALTDVSHVPEDQLISLIQLDNCLKDLAGSITQTVSLADWRASFNPPEAHWWWFLEVPDPRLTHFDWLWNALTVSSLTASLSLVVDISSRFWTTSPGVLGSLAIISQSTLTLFTVGGVLTKAGRTGIERVLWQLGIKKYFWQGVKLGVSGCLLVGLVGFRASLPQISEFFNARGLTNYIHGEWSSAMSDYERALKLDPDNEEAHYNLGRLYEDLQEFKKAQTQYRLAAQGHLDAGYNALGRLYIRDRKYAEAVSLLLTGLNLVPEDSPEVRYAFLKNLGWARFKQKRYAEAETHLIDAIELNQTSASAHCLLAQVLEKQDAKKSALPEWESCLGYADGRNPDEDAWMDLARQRIDNQEKN